MELVGPDGDYFSARNQILLGHPYLMGSKRRVKQCGQRPFPSLTNCKLDKNER